MVPVRMYGDGAGLAFVTVQFKRLASWAGVKKMLSVQRDFTGRAVVCEQQNVSRFNSKEHGGEARVVRETR